MGKKHNFDDLLKKYREGHCTDEEKALLKSWFLEELKDSPLVPDELQQLGANNAMRRALQERLTPSRRLGIPARYAVAASILVICAASFWLWRSNRTGIQYDLPPGKDRAVLTLANGKKIVLTSTKQGLVASQGTISISRSADGKLVYTASPTSASADTGFNTMSTPRGGQFQVLLPDGTHVWLNAASAITYPVAFAASERTVQISGEAYFEVAKDKNRPFHVRSAGQEITVLGTHFNVCAYADEAQTKTSLLEGSVKVTADDHSQTISPGQQTIWNKHQLSVQTVNVDMAVAWKNGEFMFRNEPLENIMKQVQRWYDVDVVYKNPALKREHFGGTISRFGNVSDVIKMLELTGTVHFKMEERRIIVM